VLVVKAEVMLFGLKKRRWLVVQALESVLVATERLGAGNASLDRHQGNGLGLMKNDNIVV